MKMQEECSCADEDAVQVDSSASAQKMALQVAVPDFKTVFVSNNCRLTSLRECSSCHRLSSCLSILSLSRHIEGPSQSVSSRESDLKHRAL